MKIVSENQFSGKTYFYTTGCSKEGISIEYKDDGVGGINPVVDLNDSLQGLTSQCDFAMTSI